MQEKLTIAGQSRLVLDPMENVIIGANLICQYLGVSSFTTLITWHELYGLPIAKRPTDGLWMTTMSAIDSWIYMASQAEAENRSYSRGTNTRADIALVKAQKRAARATARMQKEPLEAPEGAGPVMRHGNAPYGPDGPPAARSEEKL